MKHFLSLHTLPYDTVSGVPVILVDCGCSPCSLTCYLQMILYLAKVISKHNHMIKFLLLFSWLGPYHVINHSAVKSTKPSSLVQFVLGCGVGLEYVFTTGHINCQLVRLT